MAAFDEKTAQAVGLEKSIAEKIDQLETMLEAEMERNHRLLESMTKLNEKLEELMRQFDGRHLSFGCTTVPIQPDETAVDWGGCKLCDMGISHETCLPDWDRLKLGPPNSCEVAGDAILELKRRMEDERKRLNWFIGVLADYKDKTDARIDALNKKYRGKSDAYDIDWVFDAASINRNRLIDLEKRVKRLKGIEKRFRAFEELLELPGAELPHNTLEDAFLKVKEAKAGTDAGLLAAAERHLQSFCKCRYTDSDGCSIWDVADCPIPEHHSSVEVR